MSGESPISVRVGDHDVEISWSTRQEIVRQLRRSESGLGVALAFEDAVTGRAVELDRDGLVRLARELESWLDAPPAGTPLPDDARALWRALSNEARPPR